MTLAVLIRDIARAERLGLADHAYLASAAEELAAALAKPGVESEVVGPMIDRLGWRPEPTEADEPSFAVPTEGA